MSAAKYPNRKALGEALDIYLYAMYPFVSECLDDDIEEVEVKDIAHFIRTYWYDFFQEQFKIIGRYGKIRYYDARTVTSLIVEGRNRVSHQPLNDLDGEFTRAQLFFIEEILGKINRPEAQDEVNTIRNKLFDDTAEQAKKIIVETEKARYQKSIAEVEGRLASEKESNKKLSKQVASEKESNKKLSKQILDNAIRLDERRKEVATTLKAAESERDDYKRNLKTTSKELEETKSERDGYKERLKVKLKELKNIEAKWNASEERLETAMKELEEIKTEWEASEERFAAVSKHLAAVQDLFMTATLEKPEIRSIFPPLDANASVRILDRRGTEKKDYLSKLLEQRRPTLIYVQSEKMADLLLTDVLPEKKSVIEKHGPQASDAEEKGLLEKLASGESIAVVSNTVFSRLAPSHCVEHFVFCHLTPDLDEFFKCCQPAFTSEKNTHLHFIYNSEKDIEILNQLLTDKYPDRETLNNFYNVLNECIEINGDFIKPENIYSQLDIVGLGITEMGIETGLAIFEEVGALERNRDGIKLLPFSGRKSKIHQKGVELKDGIVEVCAFQLEQPIEKIWEEIQEKLDVDSEQILRGDSIDEVYPSVSEIQSDQQRTETVENDSESDAGDSEANQVPKPERANAKVTEEQLREIQSRSAAGESNSELAKEFNLSPPAIRFVAETTEGTRNEIAVKVVELRINKEGSRPIAWKKIREKLGLHNDHFHQVIRHSEGYLNAVIERIKSLKSAAGGWEYNGKFSVLTGIEDIENYLE